MIHTIGKVLCQTREQRGLSLDEAAHATKLRPDKIVALETGDYASFPSNAYARGFLQIYGRYLGVDVSADAAALDTTNRISVEDYQYLSAQGGPRPEPRNDLPDLGKRKKTSIVPLLVSVGVLVVGFLGFSTFVNWQRITGEDPRKHEAALPEPAAEEPPVIVELPAASVLAEPAAPVALPPRATVSDREFLGETVTPIPDAAVSEIPAPVPNPDRDLVSALPVQMNDVEITVTKRTWVKIRKDDDASDPIFEDYLYPNLRPLKLKGTRFLIEARDPTVIEIRKNGDPIAFQAAGVTIQ